MIIYTGLKKILQIVKVVHLSHYHFNGYYFYTAYMNSFIQLLLNFYKLYLMFILTNFPVAVFLKIFKRMWEE